MKILENKDIQLMVETFRKDGNLPDWPKFMMVKLTEPGGE